MASKQNSVHADPFSIRYEFASPEVIEGTNEKLRVDSLRMLTPDEIRLELEVLFSKLPVPVPVVFAYQRCLSCGQVTILIMIRSLITKIKQRKETHGS